MASKKTQIQEQIERATDRLAKLKARQMIKEERERARMRESERRADAHRKIKMGGLVVAAGYEVNDEHDEALLVGIILAGLANLSNAEWRQKVRARGFQVLEARKANRGSN